MRKFYNLDEAFHYQPSCPLCGESIEADYKELTMGSDLDSPSVVATFLVGGDEVSIDYYHNNVISYKEKQNHQSIFTIGSPSIIHNSTGNYSLRKSGTDIFRVNVSCTQCCQYGYVLQVYIDWKEWGVVGIYLNSESISIEEGSTLHEIKNIYATEKTEYDKFTKMEIDEENLKMSGYMGRRNSTITFPLMPLDVKNPQALLNRIKTLIIFS